MLRLTGAEVVRPDARQQVEFVRQSVPGRGCSTTSVEPSGSPLRTNPRSMG
jgi:hypothetical protein